MTHDGGSWLVVRRGRVAVVCNLGRDRRTVPLSSEPGFVYSPGAAELDGESVLVLELTD